jgi:hypothetical protein
VRARPALAARKRCVRAALDLYLLFDLRASTHICTARAHRSCNQIAHTHRLASLRCHRRRRVTRPWLRFVIHIFC